MVTRLLRFLSGARGAIRPGVLVTGGVAASAIAVAIALSQGTTPPLTGCVAGPVTYSPDSPDLWGNCWPGPNTVGIPSGTTLTAYTGPCTITVANTVIDSKIINCGVITIAALNVTISKSQVSGFPWIDDSDPTTTEASFHVVDSVLHTASAASTSESTGKSHFTVVRSLVSGGRRGIWCEYDCSVTDSYIYGQEHGVLNCTTPSCAWHEAGVRQGSGNGTTSGVQVFRHNVVACDAPDVDANEPGNESDTSGCSAAISGYGDFAPIQNNTWDRNLVLATEGGYCAYGGNSGGGKPFPNGANNTWTDNVFVKRLTGPYCGVYGTTSDYTTGLPGNVWTNNKFWNGSTLVNEAPNT